MDAADFPGDLSEASVRPSLRRLVAIALPEEAAIPPGARDADVPEPGALASGRRRARVCGVKLKGATCKLTSMKTDTNFVLFLLFQIFLSRALAINVLCEMIQTLTSMKTKDFLLLFQIFHLESETRVGVGNVLCEMIQTLRLHQQFLGSRVFQEMSRFPSPGEGRKQKAPGVLSRVTFACFYLVDLEIRPVNKIYFSQLKQVCVNDGLGG